MPPRHGKSEICSKFLPAWFLGVWPDKRVILASYEADFAASWGRKARTLLETYGGQFGIEVAAEPSAADHWDIRGHAGGMVTAGIGGPITGKGADLLIVDDPVKNREAADSPAYRKKAWDWWTSTAYTRLEPNASAIVIQTRWHQEDLAGKLLAEASSGGERWRIINFPAIAEEHDALGRRPGEALWPERYDIEALEKMRRGTLERNWAALYQQRPVPDGGFLFHRESFEVVSTVPAGGSAVRYWDKAGTAGGGDYTAGVLVAEANGIYYIVDVVRGQWSSGERNRVIRQTAAFDGPEVSVWVEREGGSGGKESAEISIQQLAGYNVHADHVTGSKVARAESFAAQCEAGNVKLLRAAWNHDFIDELTMFPNGSHDDQVDAAAGAFNKLAIADRYFEPVEEYLQL